MYTLDDIIGRAYDGPDYVIKNRFGSYLIGYEWTNIWEDANKYPSYAEAQYVIAKVLPKEFTKKHKPTIAKYEKS